MNFDRHKDDFDRLFEDVSVNINQQQTTTPPKSSGNTKEDKIDRLKQYNEYWNFEKNYHYNSQIDSTIKGITGKYGFDKKQMVKLMKDVINTICGNAATHLGLSWDMIGDDKYLFGFYETTGSKNRMQILIPYDFKFSSLKQKLLDWFLKKKEKETTENDMNVSMNSKPKKPSIKIVESVFNKVKRTNNSNIEKQVDNNIELDTEDSYNYVKKYLTNNLSVPDATSKDTLLFGSKGRLYSFDKTHILRFTTEKKFKWDTTASINTSALGCEFFLKFNDNNTFSFYVYVACAHFPQRKIYWLSDRYSVIRKQAECSPLRRGMLKNEFVDYEQPPVLPTNIGNLELVKKLCEKFTQESYNKVLEPLKDLWHYQDTDEKLYPLFEEFIYNMFIDTFKSCGIQSPMLNESVFNKVKKINRKTIEDEVDNDIHSIDFVNKEIEKFCIETWGSEKSKKEGRFFYSDAEKVTSFENVNWYKLENKMGYDTSFEEFQYFTGITELKFNDLGSILFHINKFILPKSLKILNSFSLSGGKFKSIVIPDEITSIPSNLFGGSSDVQEVIFNPTTKLTRIENSAFDDCKHLSKIDIPDSVEYIGSRAFFKTLVTKLHIPTSLKFLGGKSVCEIELDIKDREFDYLEFDTESGCVYSKDGKQLMFCSDPQGKTSPYFKNGLVIREGVEEISDYCFHGIEIQNKNISFPSTLKKIGQNCFGGFGSGAKIPKLIFNEGFEEIGEECFRDIYCIEELYLPKSLKKIGRKAFMHSFKDKTDFKVLDLSHLTNLEEMGSECFYQNHFKEVILPSPCKFKTLNGTFAFSKELEKCNIPEGVEELIGTFVHAEKLETVSEIPSSVHKLHRPFDGCKVKIEMERLPENLTDFSNLNGFVVDYLDVVGDENGVVSSDKYQNITAKNINVTEGVTELEKKSLYVWNSEAENIILPSTLTYIGEDAISTSNETKVYMKSTPKMVKFGKNPFGYFPKCTIYCDEKRYKLFTTSKKYDSIFRNDCKFKLFGDSNSNDWNDFGEKTQYEEGCFGNHLYSYKFIQRNFNRHTNETERNYWKYHHNGSEEGKPEFKEWWDFKSYSDLDTNYVLGINDLEFKKGLNTRPSTKESLMEYLKEVFCYKDPENMRVKTKVIFLDDKEIDIDIIYEHRSKADDGSNRKVWKPYEFLFKMIFDGKNESPDFKDTEIPRCLKDAEKRFHKNIQDENRWKQRFESNWEKKRQKLKKEEERRYKKEEREYQKAKLKEENRKQRELRKQLKKSGHISVDSDSVSESYKQPWFMIDFDKCL